MARGGVEAPSFVVEDHGAPHLDGEDTQPVDDVSGSDVAPAAPTPEVIPAEELWTREEAQAFLHNIWNLGFWFYGVDWLAQPFDFARSSNDAAWILDRLLPKSMGGPVGWTIKVSSIAADVGMSVGVRREIIKRGPRSPTENMQELAKRYGLQPEKPPTGAEPREEPAPRPQDMATPAKKEQPFAVVADSSDDGFKFSPEVRRAMENFPDGSRGYDQTVT